MSDQPKWTPGTWVALSASGNATDPLQIVASAPPWWGKDSKLIASGFQNINPEANANLQLIAAAPRLYTALEALLNSIDDYCGEPDRGHHQQQRNTARAALTQARGEAAPAERLIELLNLNTRTRHCLKKAHIQTIEQLAEKTEAEVLRVPGIWGKGLAEIRKALAGMGLSLRESA
jgi:DNA-directed RNA polymerase alpha subunit